MLELGAAPQFLKMWLRITPNLFGKQIAFMKAAWHFHV
jgi:hypothetical protein